MKHEFVKKKKAILAERTRQTLILRPAITLARTHMERRETMVNLISLSYRKIETHDYLNKRMKQKERHITFLRFKEKATDAKNKAQM
jgi:hypothetical protein